MNFIHKNTFFCQNPRKNINLMFGFLRNSGNFIFTLRCRFSSSQEIYYPVVNCQLRCSHIYPSRYVDFCFLFLDLNFLKGFEKTFGEIS